MASSLQKSSIIFRRLNPGGIWQGIQKRPFFSGIFGDFFSQPQASKSTATNQTLKQKKNKSPNRNETRKITNKNIKTMLSLVTREKIAPVKQRITAQPKTVEFTASKANIHTAYVLNFQLPLIALRTIHEGYQTRTHTNQKFIELLSAIQTKKYADVLLQLSDKLRNNVGKDYSSYSGKFRDIDPKIKAMFNTFKPVVNKGNKKIQTHLDHIVPLNDISMKVIMMNFINLKLDFRKIHAITNEESFIEYFKKELNNVLPTIDDLEIVINIYNSEINLRLLDDDSHDIYSYIVAHGINKQTGKPQTWLDQIDMGREGKGNTKKREPGEIPRQIEGYSVGSKNQNNGKTYDKIEVLNYIVQKNNIICDTLSSDNKNSAWVKKFATNMKSYIHRRAGHLDSISRGGGKLQFNEYDIYELIVFSLEDTDKNINTNSRKVATTKDIRDSLEKITIDILLYLVNIYRESINILENIEKDKQKKLE